MKVIRCVALLATWLYAVGAVGSDTITVAWRDKAPYHYLENGVPQGFLLQRAKQVFAQADIPVIFVETPAKRIWHDFEQGRHAFCSIGWYRLPERERLGQFSHSLHTDPPQTLLVGPKARHYVQGHASFAALLADPSIEIGMVDGVSYGAQLDALIAHSANRIKLLTVPPLSLMRMVAADRVTYMLADQADWQYLRSHESGLENLTEQHFADMPPGLKRYIICSKDVPKAVMQRLNQAIDALPEKS